MISNIQLLHLHVKYEIKELIIIFHMRGLTVIFKSYYIFSKKNMIFTNFVFSKNLKNTKLYLLFSPT